MVPFVRMFVVALLMASAFVLASSVGAPRPAEAGGVVVRSRGFFRPARVKVVQPAAIIAPQAVVVPHSIIQPQAVIVPQQQIVVPQVYSRQLLIVR